MPFTPPTRILDEILHRQMGAHPPHERMRLRKIASKTPWSVILFPQQSRDDAECSAVVIQKIEAIIIEDEENTYDLLSVEAGERLNFADVTLPFRRRRKRSESVTGHVDVKAASKDILNSSKSPNITSFVRIHTEYIQNPDLNQWIKDD